MLDAKLIATSLAIIAGMAVEASANEQDPLAVVQSLAAAMQAADDPTIVEAFTEDAGYAYSLEGALSRGERFDAWLTSDITGPDSIFEIEEATVNGDTVDTLVVWGRGGNAASEARYVFTVIDGRIDSWRMTGR